MTAEERQALDEAVAMIESDPDHKVHSVGIGMRDGKYVVEVETDAKMTAQALKDQGVKEIPKVIAVVVNGQRHDIETSVVQEPKFEAKPVDPSAPFAQAALSQDAPEMSAQALLDELRKCQNHLKSGVEIAPHQKGWVGTLGGAVIDVDTGRHCMFTNSHVAGAISGLAPGHVIGQPGGNGGPIGRLVRSVHIDMAPNANNLVDLCIVSDDEADRSGNKKLYAIPEMAGVGKIDPRPYSESEVTIGLAVQKSGRTTSYTTGKIERIGNTSHVGYDAGTARFVRQYVVRGDSGNFSAPGDSGSLVVDMNGRPVGHLYAGGGGTTLLNPIAFSVELGRMRFFN